jgi:predicted regulator of Ras-like GTPase activity (Roadblock/LC7/MglB family)
MVKQKKSFQETAGEIEPITVGGASYENNMRFMLEEIKKCEGVIGYILRNTTSAAIDLNDPSKIIDYATLSSTAFEASEKLSELIDLGKVKTIIVEGKDTKTLHLSIDENNVSIFMEKNADAQKILEKIRARQRQTTNLLHSFR